MKHVVICRTDGTVEDMAMTEDHDFRWFGKQIGTDIIQTVYANGLKMPYLILCDEEGLFREKPTINILGSWLYGTQDHGEPIVGDIMIVKETVRDGEPDFGGMSEGEADVLAEWLLDNFWAAHDQVLIKVRHRLMK